MKSITCTPALKWPTGYARTSSPTWAKFGNGFGDRPSIAAAIGRLQAQLGTRNWLTSDEVLTANVPVGGHGSFKSNQSEPLDRGVAFYFEMEGKSIVLACDKWNRVADNITAIAKTLEAMRGMDRWGVTECERVFTGFAALPETSVTGATFYDVLGLVRDVPPTLERIDACYRAKAWAAHPDHGGSDEAMAALNTARDQAYDAVQHRTRPADR